MLHWIIQEGFEQERGWPVVYETMERFGLQHTYCKVVPFSHQLQPWIEPGGDPKIVLGSITLGKIAEQNYWYPGCFTNSNFDYRRWRAELRPYLLNPDMTVCRFGDVEPGDQAFFIRPVLDDKSFAGQVFNPEDFDEWRARVAAVESHYTTLDLSTVVCWGPVRRTHQEFRFFVVEGEVVTGSQYKLGRRVVQDRQAVSQECLAFARRMVDKWQPHRAFCLDVALVDTGYRVIEVGCLNSCGFYDADVQKLILRLEEVFG